MISFFLSFFLITSVFYLPKQSCVGFPGCLSGKVRLKAINLTEYCRHCFMFSCFFFVCFFFCFLHHEQRYYSPYNYFKKLRTTKKLLSSPYEQVKELNDFQFNYFPFKSEKKRFSFHFSTVLH